MKLAAVILADGCEEIEAITPIDLLRRAGIQIITVSLGSSLQVNGSHGISLEADVPLDDFPAQADAIIIPGGMPGSRRISENEKILQHIRAFHSESRVIGAICAAPALVLSAAGILAGRKFCCYPGFEKRADPKAIYQNAPLVQDGNIISANGVGSAASFSAALITALVDKEKAQEIMSATLQPLM